MKTYTSITYKILAVILVQVIVGLIVIASLTHRDPMPEHQARSSVQDSMIELSRDSLSAFMSVIIEANQTLVTKPQECRWLLLTEISEPSYASKDSQGRVTYAKPTLESVKIWIPTSVETYSSVIIGSSIPKDSMPIGNTLYNGDLEHVKARVIGKIDRGF